MGGQALERREVMRILALASAASAFPGFRRWAFACNHEDTGNGSGERAGGPFAPQFFSPDEFTTVERMAELIIPNDGKPGAREAGVSEFIDFMVASDPNLQPRFRYGLGWIDAHARWLHGKPFREAPPPEQTEILEHLAYKDRYRPGEEDGRAFFALMRDYTVMGFYTSRIGLDQLDFPGLKTTYAQMPGCAHHDDPEHLHLPPPAQ